MIILTGKATPIITPITIPAICLDNLLSLIISRSTGDGGNSRTTPVTINPEAT